MIASLNGTLLLKSQGSVVLQVSGVGFEVALAPSSIARLPEVGEEVFLLTYLQVTETALALYGFLNEEERNLFEKLISVSGVGPKGALAALSTYEPSVLINMIMEQDVAGVQKIPGVGKKTASRIILELKGSFDDLAPSLFVEPEVETPTIAPGIRDAVTGALLAMGFTSTEAELALRDAPDTGDEAALLSYALKRLGAGAK